MREKSYRYDEKNIFGGITMAFCHSCGTSVQAQDIFCPQCGIDLHAASASTTQTASQPLRHQGVGIRFAAHLIDGVLMLVLYFIIGNIVAPMFGGLTPDGFELHGAPALFFMFLMFVCITVYFTLLEGFWHGQTIGKKMLRIRVVKENGSELDLDAALMRNILRVVDFLLFYLVGAICIWSSPKKQRFGDRIAHTVVIKK